MDFILEKERKERQRILSIQREMERLLTRMPAVFQQRPYIGSIVVIHSLKARYKLVGELKSQKVSTDELERQGVHFDYILLFTQYLFPAVGSLIFALRLKGHRYIHVNWFSSLSTDQKYCCLCNKYGGQTIYMDHMNDRETL